MLPSSGRSIGEQSITTLPANRSIIIADSRFRKDNVLDEPYNFNCDLSGTGIYAKEIYYQKLFWNQPIFSHNNASAELLFQMNGDTTKTYVVYALPFTMFQQYDGNATPGSPLQTPQPFSYASMMEIGLTYDVRLMPLNTTPINGDGRLRDPNNIAHYVKIAFRYSPSKGFCIFPIQDSPTPGYFYTIKLLSCSWVNAGHYVHGFGFFNPNGARIEYAPHDFFSTAIWSDVTPNLLPIRYIVVQSPELNKDRRLISFHNGNSANFVNELGIFSINAARTGIFHEVGVGDDATVISLRDDYTPQTFRIQILDEYGNQMKCSDNLSALIQSPGVDPSVIASYMSDPILKGRGNSLFIDYLVFGYRTFYENYFLAGQATLNSTNILPVGMANQYITYQYIDFNAVGSIGPHLNLNFCTPLILSSLITSLTPIGQGIGFNVNSAHDAQFAPNTDFRFTVLTWYPNLNPFPTIRWDFQFENCVVSVPPAGGGTKAYFYTVMFDATTFQPIMYSRTISKAPFATILSPIVSANKYQTGWTRNPEYVIPEGPVTIQVGYCLAWVGNDVPFLATYFTMYGPSSPVPPFPRPLIIQNPNTPSGVQTEYVPPNTLAEYDFGDPQAIALCEEVIHEIAAILEYN